jgi:hypothetical protein
VAGLSSEQVVHLYTVSVGVGFAFSLLQIPDPEKIEDWLCAIFLALIPVINIIYGVVCLICWLGDLWYTYDLRKEKLRKIDEQRNHPPGGG